MRRAARRLDLAVTCFLSATSVASGQHVSVAAVDAWTTHDLVERPSGFAASVAFPLTPRWSFSAGLERVQGDQAGTGVVCGGFILERDRCPIEPFTQVGRLTLGSIGFDASLLRTTYIELVARPQLLAGSVKSSERGTTTGNNLTAKKIQVGYSAALELRLFPVRRLPLGLVGGVAARRVGPPPGDSDSLDDYTPFQWWYSERTIYAGLALSPPEFRRLPFRPAPVNR